MKFISTAVLLSLLQLTCQKNIQLHALYENGIVVSFSFEELGQQGGDRYEVMNQIEFRGPQER